MDLLFIAPFKTFRRLLINKCQDEFENRSRAFAAFESKTFLTPEDEEQRTTAKIKMLGNIQFIGKKMIQIGHYLLALPERCHTYHGLINVLNKPR